MKRVAVWPHHPSPTGRQSDRRRSPSFASATSTLTLQSVVHATVTLSRPSAVFRSSANRQNRPASFSPASFATVALSRAGQLGRGLLQFEAGPIQPSERRRRWRFGFGRNRRQRSHGWQRRQRRRWQWRRLRGWRRGRHQLRWRDRYRRCGGRDYGHRGCYRFGWSRRDDRQRGSNRRGRQYR